MLVKDQMPSPNAAVTTAAVVTGASDARSGSRATSQAPSSEMAPIAGR
jgi:hypothetical protein